MLALRALFAFAFMLVAWPRLAGQEVFLDRKQSGRITNIAFSGDMKTFAVIQEKDSFVRLVQFPSMKTLGQLRMGTTNYGTLMSLGDSGDLLALEAPWPDDYSVQILDLKNPHKSSLRLPVAEKIVWDKEERPLTLGISVNQEKPRLVALRNDLRLIFWDEAKEFEQGKPISLEWHKINGIALLSQNRLLATSRVERNFQVWQITGKKISFLTKIDFEWEVGTTFPYPSFPSNSRGFVLWNPRDFRFEVHELTAGLTKKIDATDFPEKLRGVTPPNFIRSMVITKDLGLIIAVFDAGEDEPQGVLFLPRSREWRNRLGLGEKDARALYFEYFNDNMQLYLTPDSEWLVFVDAPDYANRFWNLHKIGHDLGKSERVKYVK